MRVRSQTLRKASAYGKLKPLLKRLGRYSRKGQGPNRDTVEQRATSFQEANSGPGGAGNGALRGPKGTGPGTNLTSLHGEGRSRNRAMHQFTRRREVPEQGHAPVHTSNGTLIRPKSLNKTRFPERFFVQDPPLS